MNCESCKDLVFDVVYGLLDESEANAVRDHAASCPTCAVELAQAKTDQHKLGRAALAMVEVPEFKVPTDETPSQPTAPAVQPASLPIPSRRGLRPITVIAWAASLACCLVVAFVLAFNHREAMDKQEVVVANLVKQQIEVESRLASLDANFAKEQKALPDRVNRDAVQLHVAGPGRVTPGVSAPFQIALRDLDGQAKSGKVEVSFVDGKNNVLSRQSVDVAKATEIPVPTELAKSSGPVRMKAIASVEGKVVGEVAEMLAVTPPALAGHIATNKLLYKPGDKLLVRVLALDRVTLKPAANGDKLQVAFVNDDGVSIAPALALTTLAGIGSGEFVLPGDLVEGSYSLVASGDRLTPVRRRIDVLPATAPPAEVLVQNKNRVRAGDAITIQLYNADGKPAANAPVAGNAVISNQNYDARNNANYQQSNNGVAIQGRADGEGRYQMKLPVVKDALQNRQQLNVDLVYGDDKQKALITQPIDVTPSRVVVDFFPEGGHLIAGTPNRVFYRVRAPEGDSPASGRIAIQAGDKTVFDSGRERSFGSFTFTPDVKETYSLKILSPKKEDVAQPFASLGIESDGLLLRGATVQRGDGPLALALESRGGERLVQIVATCRGEIVAHQRATVKDKTSLDVPVAVDGVIRITAFEVKDGHLTPLAERLFYRTPARTLDIAATLSPDPMQSPAQLRITGRDERQTPLAFWSLASVVDDRFRGDVPEPSLASHFLILGDTPEGADWSDLPIVGVDGAANPAALELTLGVLGWRRVSAPAINPEMLAKGLDQTKRDGVGDRAGDKKTKEGKADADKAAGDLAKAEATKRGMAGGFGATAPGATFFYRVQPSVFEIRQKLEEKWQLSQLALVNAAKKQQGEVSDERTQVARLLSNARIELEELSRRPRERMMAALGILALGLLVLGGAAMVFGLIRLLRRSAATGPFGLACACLAGCFVLIAFQPRDDANPASRVVAEAATKKTKDFSVQSRSPAPGEKADAFRQANATVKMGSAAMEAKAHEAGGMGNEPAHGPALGMAPMDAQVLQDRKGAVAARRHNPPSDQIARFEQSRSGLARELQEAERKSAGSPEAAGRGGRSLMLEQPKAMAGFGAGGGGIGGPLAKSAVVMPAMPPSNLPGAAPAAKMSEAKDPKPMAAPDAGVPAAPAGIAAEPPRDALFKRFADEQRVELGSLRRQFEERRSKDLADLTTLLWAPAVLVAPNGASLSFDVPATPARYRVFILGHTEDGRLGTFDGVLNSK